MHSRDGARLRAMRRSIDYDALDPGEDNADGKRALRAIRNGWQPYLPEATEHRELHASHSTLFREDGLIATVGQTIERFVRRVAPETAPC